MKLKNIIFSLILMFVMFFASTVHAESKAPASYNVSGKDIYMIDSSKHLPNGGFYDYNFHFKKNTNGDIIYCTQSHDNAVTSGTQKYTLSKELDSRYAYVLANGYPNKSITGNNEKDYFITGLAVFYLVNPSDWVFNHLNITAGTYRGASSDVAKEVFKLVDGANKYSYTNPSIKIGSNDKFVLSSDKKYYVSSNIGVTTTGNVGNYTVSLDGAPSGTIVTDTNGNAKSSFGVNESFVVKVPVSSIKNLSNEFKVNVSASGTIYKAYLYEPSQSRYQNTAALYPEVSNVKDSTTLKLNLNTEVQITKVDVTNSKELAGAKLVVKNSSGKVVDSWVSTTSAHIIKGLSVGKYTLTEEIAPDGYVLSTETIDFEVKADGTVTKVTMENAPTEVQISKIDVTTGKELPGAKLTVKDSKGKVVETWTSTNEVHIIRGLKAGKYTLAEEIAPEGYKLSTEVKEFEVKADGTVIKVVMKNEPEEIKYVYISKQDVTTSEELAGAHLELKDEKGNLIEAWVSGNEPHMIEDLKPGKYYLTEVLAPEGYKLSTETVEFTVKKDGTVDDVIVMYNEPDTIVPVPSTSSFKTITASLIGFIIIGLGSMIIYKNYKKNEEY